MARDDTAQEIQQSAIFESAREQFIQGRVVDAIEVLADVEFQEVRETPGECLRALETGDTAFALAAGIGIVNEPAFKNRFADVHDGMMEHALLEARRGDQPLLRIVDDELVESAKLNVIGQQLAAKSVEIGVQVGNEFSRIGFAPLASQCLGGCLPQVLPGGDGVKQVSRSLHGELPPIAMPRGIAVRTC